MTASLEQIVAANRAGARAGIPSYCTAHRETLQAILGCYRGNDLPVLIEATCNQVNQEGGYTGMTPADFRRFILDLADGAGVERSRIILGGDHLGPNPWRSLPAQEAMARAERLVRAYVEAGFTKIHLDASMACADDGTLAEREIAERAARLAAVAEQQAGGAALAYIIGTEVPKPGGETEELGGLAVTRPDAVMETYELHRKAFAGKGLQAALERVIGIVVQPGVDFGNSQIFDFDKNKAGDLSRTVSGIRGAAFEAHSTDYQRPGALTELVSAHFAILKVGPELTAAYREAVVAMASIESWLPIAGKSDILDVIDGVMMREPKYWRDYVAGGERARLERLFGLSDRIRYYWPNPAIQAGLKLLYANVDAAAGEAGLIAQFAGLPEGRATPGAPLSRQIIEARVGGVVAKYAAACS